MRAVGDFHHRSFSRNPRAFGPSGAGDSLGFADPDAGLGFGDVVNQAITSATGGDPRWAPLLDALCASLG